MPTSRQTPGTLWLLAALILLAAGLWNLSVWIHAFHDAGSQPERVALYLSRLPSIIAGLGVHGVTLLLVLIGGAGTAAAYVSSRRLASALGRAVAWLALLLNLLLTFWHLFTLM